MVQAHKDPMVTYNTTGPGAVIMRFFVVSTSRKKKRVLTARQYIAQNTSLTKETFYIHNLDIKIRIVHVKKGNATEFLWPTIHIDADLNYWRSECSEISWDLNLVHIQFWSSETKTFFLTQAIQFHIWYWLCENKCMNNPKQYHFRSNRHRALIKCVFCRIIFRNRLSL